MIYIKLFEDFKNNNKEGSLITVNDIINCINNNGVLFTKIIKNLPNDNEIELKPLSVDDDGLITIEYGGNDYEVELKNVDKIQY